MSEPDELEDPGYDYADAVNAPLSEATMRALAARLASGDFPIRRVRRLADPLSETPPAQSAFHLDTLPHGSTPRATCCARRSVMAEAWDQIEAPMRERADRDAAQIRIHLAEDHAAAEVAARDAKAADGRDGTRWRTDGENVYCEWATIARGPHGYIGDDVGAHIVRHDPARVLSQSASIGDALTELEQIAERSPDPDSRMWARGAIHLLARIWVPAEKPGVEVDRG